MAKMGELVVAVNSTPDVMAFVRKVCAEAAIPEPLVSLDGAEAPDFLRRHAAEVRVAFLLDRPGKPAGETLLRLRRHAVPPWPPLIVVSERPELVDEAMRFGADGFLAPDGSIARAGAVLAGILGDLAGFAAAG